MPETETNTEATQPVPGLLAPSEVPPEGDNQNIEQQYPGITACLEALLKKFQFQDKYARRVEVIEARRQRFYDRGDQYIYWNSTSFMFVPVTGGASLQVGSESVDMPRYTDVYNIYHAYGRNIAAVLAQNPPGVNFNPVDPADSDDITAAKEAEKYRQIIDIQNDRKALQLKIARLFFTDGRVCLYTRTVCDAQKFGMGDDGKPNCGEVIDAMGVLEHKTPILADSQVQKPYEILSDEMDICTAKAEYPAYADKIKPNASGSAGESAYERMARLGVLQGTRLLMQAGDAYAHIVTRHRLWLRPSAFKEAEKEMQPILEQLFPQGLTLRWVGDTYCGCWAENMDDHLVVGFAQPGDGQSRPSWGKPLVPIQDAYNDYKNMRKEYHDYGIPVMLVDDRAVDIDSFREQISEPGNAVSLTVGDSGLQSVADCYSQTAPVEVPADLIQAETDLRDQLAQFVTGAFPALFGGDTKANDTLGGIAIQRDQAMGVMGVPWGMLQEMYSKAYEQAVLLAAERAEEDQVVNVPSQGTSAQVQPVQMSNLKKGKFKARPDVDSSFPATESAKKQAFQQVMAAAEFNPVLMEAAVEPENMEMALELGGLPDFVIPAANAADKQKREIEQLLKTAPIPPNPDMIQHAIEDHAMQATSSQVQGMPPPPPPNPEDLMEPSVPIDPVFDLHKYHFQIVQNWLQSEERYDQEAAGNMEGIENVRLHGIAHQKLMAQQAAPPPLPPQPPVLGGKPKGPQPQAPQGVQ